MIGQHQLCLGGSYPRTGLPRFSDVTAIHKLTSPTMLKFTAVAQDFGPTARLAIV